MSPILTLGTRGFDRHRWTWTIEIAAPLAVARAYWSGVFKAGLFGLLLVGVLAVGSQLPNVWSFAVRTAHSDQVHYNGHLLAGRLLSLCPCTAHIAEVQYARGLYHARTPAQAALLTTQRPTSTRARLVEARSLIAKEMRQLAYISQTGQGTTG